MDKDMILRLVEAVRETIENHREELTRLDQAIGDGDHGEAMQRGIEAVVAERERISEQSLQDALVTTGRALVMSMGGASGPLYGTFFMELGKALPENPERSGIAAAFAHAVSRVAARGKSERGQKTLLDVLYPVSDLLAGDRPINPAEVARAADIAAEATIPLMAKRGRAAFLGERSMNHMDPGARSAALVIGAVCAVLQGEPG